jgi:hypothetical protein
LGVLVFLFFTHSIATNLTSDVNVVSSLIIATLIEDLNVLIDPFARYLFQDM